MIRADYPAPEFDRFLDLIAGVGPDACPIAIDTPAYADFPGDEFQQRYARMTALMTELGIDALVLTQEENVRYTTGYQTGGWISRFRPHLAILPRDPALGPVVAVPGFGERENVRTTSWVETCLMYSPQGSAIPDVVAALAERGLAAGRIGIELGFGQRIGMTVGQLHELAAALPMVEFVDAGPIVQTVRMLKSPNEVDRLARACRISEEAVAYGWSQLQAGMTERELVGIMAAHMYRAGADVGTKPAFLAIMAGERWPLSNATPSDYPIKKGDLVMVDGGATYRGYVCDFIRQAVLGTAKAEERRWFDAIVAANDAAISAVRPGIPAHEVFAVSQASLAEHGFSGRSRSNIIGHGIGMDIHELPWIGASTVYTADVHIREGMVLSIEPAILQKGVEPAGHYTLEDVVAVTADGVRNLTASTSKSLLELTG